MNLNEEELDILRQALRQCADHLRDVAESLEKAVDILEVAAEKERLNSKRPM
jgi:hypothetical protein